MNVLMAALKRFGLPDDFVDMVRGIYVDRKFFVQDCGNASRQHPQASGISQGCPLSPFLFVILMTVLLNDAKKKWVEQCPNGVREDTVATELA